MVFAALISAVTAGTQCVSIPSRGLWFLRLCMLLLWSDSIVFQSLVGVYGFCGAIGD